MSACDSQTVQLELAPKPLWVCGDRDTGKEPLDLSRGDVVKGAQATIRLLAACRRLHLTKFANPCMATLNASQTCAACLMGGTTGVPVKKLCKPSRGTHLRLSPHPSPRLKRMCGC